VLAAQRSADAGSDELRRARAALALGHGARRDERAVPLLARALASERTPVRTCAALSLLRFGAAARPALTELQGLRQDDQAIVRELAEYVLAQPGLR
jgi:HEAT repeat protein